MSHHITTAGGIAVTDLLKILDGSGLTLASEQTQRRLPLTSATFFDPLSPPTGRRSGILLGIGVDPAAPETAEVVRLAASLGFGALVVKTLGATIGDLATIADSVGIALLVVDTQIEWRQLDALLGSALASAAETKGSTSSMTAGDLFALANAIAAVVGGATAIEDMQERVLAYSALPGQAIDEERREGILGRQVPKLPENAEQYASVFRTQGALRVPGTGPGLGRLAVAVRAGAEALGSIWVVDDTGELDADAVGALESSADIAALHMLRARSAADLAKQQREEQVRHVLQGDDDAHLVVEQLGLDASGLFVVLAFQPDFAPTVDEVRLARLVDLVTMQCEAHWHGTECAVIGNTVYALLAGVPAFELEAAKALTARLVDRACTGLHLPVRGAIGSTASTIGQISRSRHDADLVLLLLANRPAPFPVASADDVRSQLTLLELAQIYRDTPRILSPKAKRLLDYDAKSGSDYAKTLRTYLDCSRDSAETASRLSLHQNTLRYRLRRASELFDIDLNSADDTLILWLSLRLSQFD